MKKMIVLLFVGLITFACVNKNTHNEANKVGTPSNEQVVGSVNLEGAWGTSKEENARFGFYGDSVYYPDPDLWCTFQIKNDTIIIFLEDIVHEKFIVRSISRDSLIIFYPEYEMQLKLMRLRL